MDLSLDEFIRRKKAAGEDPFLNIQKKDKKLIDKDKLDAELDLMAENNKSLEVPNNVRSTLSKFERIRLTDDVFDDDEDMPTQNSSINFAKYIAKMDHPNCCKSKPFTTIEEKQKIKIKSQQWRVESNRNPPGTSKNGVRNGRIGKNNNNFVRGNFTYNFRESASTFVSGIARNNNFPSRPQNCNIQVNADDLLPLLEHNQMAREQAPPPYELHGSSKPPAGNKINLNMNLNLEIDDLLSFLQAKKKRTEQEAASGNPFFDQYERDAFGGDSFN